MSSRRNRARDERGALRQDTQEVTLNEVTDAIFGSDLSAINSNYPMTIALDRVQVLDEIQVRVDGLDREWVATLVTILENDGEVNPIEVFQEGDGYILADGFHRVEAYRQLNFAEIKALVRTGGYAAAVERAEEANLEHGLRLSMEDKREIFSRRLKRNHEWAQLSNREIARRLGVSAPTISNWMVALSADEGEVIERGATVGKDGKLRDTRNISKHERQKQSISPDKAYEILLGLEERLGLSALQALEKSRREQVIDLLETWLYHLR